MTTLKSFDFCPRLHFPGAERSSPKDPRLHHRGVDEEVSDLSSCLIFPGQNIFFLGRNFWMSFYRGRISEYLFFLGIFGKIFFWHYSIKIKGNFLICFCCLSDFFLLNFIKLFSNRKMSISNRKISIKLQNIWQNSI